MGETDSKRLFSGKLIYVLDDDPDSLFLAQRTLQSIGCDRIRSFGDSVDFLTQLKAGRLQSPDLFLFDVMMPGFDGPTVARVVREDPRHQDAGIVFLTSQTREQSLEECFAAGAQDFLNKPLSRAELFCRLRNLFRLQDLNRGLAQRNEELTITSITDRLTGVYNRAYLDQRLLEEFGKCRRYGHTLAFLMLDIDQFKQVNDTHGHQAGDEVLAGLGHLLREMLRTSDLVARYGGEEFSLILAGSGDARARETAERIRRAVLAAMLCPSVPTLHITASLGVAVCTEDVSGADELVRRADAALYQAKKSGRDRTVVWTATSP